MSVWDKISGWRKRKDNGQAFPIGGTGGQPRRLPDMTVSTVPHDIIPLTEEERIRQGVYTDEEVADWQQQSSDQQAYENAANKAEQAGNPGLADKLRKIGANFSRNIEVLGSKVGTGLGEAARAGVYYGGRAASGAAAGAVAVGRSAAGQYIANRIKNKFWQIEAKKLLSKAYSADPATREAAKYALNKQFPDVYASAFGRRTSGNRWVDMIEAEYAKEEATKGTKNPYHANREKINLWEQMYRAEMYAAGIGMQRPRNVYMNDSDRY